MSKHRSFQFLASGIIAASLAACAPYVQDSSGREYVNRTLELPGETAVRRPDSGAFRERLRAAANVEPGLRFPAKIGLARIDGGELTSVPPPEAEAWLKLSERLGPRFGQFVPISPLITEMVAGEQGETTGARRDYARRYSVADTIRKLRLGAARQHVDIVLIYELAGTSDNTATILSVADVSILGMFIVPSRHVKAEGFAHALLLDVRNGYPYGTASARTTDQNLVPAMGSSARTGDLLHDVRTSAALKLVGEVEKLTESLYARQPAR